MRGKKENQGLMTIACHQAPFRRKDRKKTHNCHWQLNLISWPVNASRWSSAPSLLPLPLLAGQHPPGSCAASSYGEEEEETFVSLTLQEPLVWDLYCFLLHEGEAFVSRQWLKLRNWIQQFSRCFLSEGDCCRSLAQYLQVFYSRGNQ